MAQDESKSALIAELADARSRLAANAHALGRALDFPTRAKQAVGRNPLAWIGGAAAFGLLMAKLPPRTKKGVVARKDEDSTATKVGKASLLLGALKIAFSLARPALTTWATQRISDYTTARRRQDSFPR